MVGTLNIYILILSFVVIGCENLEKSDTISKTLPKSQTHQTPREAFSDKKISGDEYKKAEGMLRDRLQNYISKQTFITTEQAEKKWGSIQYNPETYSESSFEIKAKMIVWLVQSKKLIGRSQSVASEILGRPNGYFYSDHIPAYIFMQGKENDKNETWQLVLLTTADGEILETKIHKQ